jgi:carbon catabolite-derepressing protein kinase
VRINLQLYQVDDVNYLVDFHHKRSYKARTGGDKFEMSYPRPKPIGRAVTNNLPGRENDNPFVTDHHVVSPFVFMDVACRLIIELAGGASQP